MNEGRYGFDEIDDMIRLRIYQDMEERGLDGVESLIWVSLMTWERGKDHVEVILRTGA